MANVTDRLTDADLAEIEASYNDPAFHRRSLGRITALIAEVRALRAERDRAVAGLEHEIVQAAAGAARAHAEGRRAGIGEAALVCLRRYSEHEARRAAGTGSSVRREHMHNRDEARACAREIRALAEKPEGGG